MRTTSQGWRERASESQSVYLVRSKVRCLDVRVCINSRLHPVPSYLPVSFFNHCIPSSFFPAHLPMP